MGSMYETLRQLPLFAGVSQKKLSEIVGHNKFHFLKYAPGDMIVEQGAECTHIRSVIAGSVRMSIESHDNKFKASQTLNAPDLIAPDFFFGRTTRYPGSVTAIDNVGILQINKPDFLNIINSDSIFLFNYLNILSMNAQLNVDGVMALASGSLEKRIAYWIVALTQNNGTDIVLQCRQRDMYAVFGVQRQSLISALDAMKADGIIDYTNQEIQVADRRRLVEILTGI